jgi:uncharacterized repeat protein (TIGR03803 family)
MKQRIPHSRFFVMLAAFTLVLTAAALANNETLVHEFNGTPVKYPSSGVIADSSGNLFGTSFGAVYELSPVSGGRYNYRVIANLPGSANDQASGNLALDAAGNLYGTTSQGGANNAGYIYELSGAAWTFSILHSFTVQEPFGAGTLTLDASGNLYGATFFGGTNGQGGVYELEQNGGSWTFKTLYNFTGSNGLGSLTGVTFDASGNLYGGNITSIYKLTPNGDGTWAESTAYTFNDHTEGYSPEGNLIFDAAGNMYGTNTVGGLANGGTAFELSPTESGGWTSTILHSFGKTGDGDSPNGGLTSDGAGSFYGVTLLGGNTSNSGTVFKLAMSAGVWHESVLYRFSGGSDGASPEYPPYLNSNTLYGTTYLGGNSACDGGCGTVFAIH